MSIGTVSRALGAVRPVGADAYEILKLAADMGYDLGRSCAHRGPRRILFVHNRELSSLATNPTPDAASARDGLP